MKPLLTLLAATQLLGSDFSFNLAEKIENSEKNWIFSPYSISTCLSMAELGANGKTADEIRRVLNLEQTVLPKELKHSPFSESDFDLRIIQGLWVKTDFEILDTYAAALHDSYQPIVERVEFTPMTCHRINQWVAHHTENKIQNLLSEENLNEDTRLVLANALYFRGKWLEPFQTQYTHPRLFYPYSGSEVEIPFMTRKGNFLYTANEDAQAILLPFYKQSQTCTPVCFIVMPRQNVSLSAQLFESLYHNLAKQSVQLFLPKLTLEMEIDLNEPLRALGMETAFSYSADFSNIDQNGGLFLSQVLHKSFLSLDETGVEAAAATASIINTTTSLPSENLPIDFIADHPFYLFLLDKNSEAILFMGKFQNPRS